MIRIHQMVVDTCDRLLEPLRASQELQQSTSADSEATCKQKGNFEWVVFFLFQWNFFLFFFLIHPNKRGGGRGVLTAQLSCHLSPWHKSERKDFYNGWHRCCKLVSPCCLSSHWAYKHPLHTETLTGALRRVTALGPDVGRPVVFHSATEEVDQTWQIKNLNIYRIVAAACLIINAASPGERGGATVGGEFRSTRGHLTLPFGETEKDDGGYLRRRRGVKGLKW